MAKKKRTRRLQLSMRILSVMKEATLIPAKDLLVWQLPPGTNANIARDLVNKLKSKLDSFQETLSRFDKRLAVWKEGVRTGDSRTYFIKIRTEPLPKKIHKTPEHLVPKSGILAPEYNRTSTSRYTDPSIPFQMRCGGEFEIKPTRETTRLKLPIPYMLRPLSEVPSGKADTEMAYKVNLTKKGLMPN